jgi:hypothetical protein
MRFGNRGGIARLGAAYFDEDGAHDAQLMMLVSIHSARDIRANAINSWWIKPSEARACKDSSVTSTLSIISQKT